MTPSVPDMSEAIGIGAGILLILAGLGILSRMPWQYTPGGAITMVAQGIGSIALIVIGAGFIWLLFQE